MKNGTVTNSPVENTLKVLERRLLKTEEETQKLANHVQNYGFKRFPAEKPSIDLISKDWMTGTENGKEKLVNRMCVMESTLQALHEGFKSLQSEKSCSINDLQKEKYQVQEEYKKELHKRKEEIRKYKTTIESHEKAKDLLAKQNNQLKDEVAHLSSLEKNVQKKNDIYEKDIQSLREEVTKISNVLNIEREDRKRFEDLHQDLVAKVSYAEDVIKKEQQKIDILEKQCEKLSQDAKTACLETEKGQATIKKLHNLLRKNEDNYETANDNLRQLVKENSTLNHELKERTDERDFFMSKTETFQVALEQLKSYTSRLEDDLKVSALDNETLLQKAKETISKEQTKSKLESEEHEKVVENIKSSMTNAYNKLQERFQYCEKEKENSKEQLVTSNKKCHKLEIEKSNLQKDMEMKLASLSKENHEYEVTLNEIKSNVSISNKKLKDDMIEVAKEKDELVKTINSLKLEIVAKNTSVANFKNEMKMLQERLSWKQQQESCQNALEKRIAESTQEISDMAYKYGSLQQSFHVITEENEQFKRENANLQSISQKLKTTISFLEEEKTSIEKKFINTEKHLKEKDSQVSHLENLKYKLESQISEQRNTIKEISIDRDNANNEIESLMQHISELKNNFEDRIMSLQMSIAAKDNERNEYGNSFHDFIILNEQLQHQITQLQTELGKRDIQLSYLTKQARVSENDTNDKNTITSLWNNTSSADHCFKQSTQKEDLMKVKSENKSLLVQVKSLKEELSETKSKCKSQNTELKNLRKIRKEEKDRFKQHVEDEKLILKKDLAREMKKVKGEMVAEKKEFQEKYDLLNQQHLLVSKRCESLESARKLYVEKNNSQADLLKNFMQQIADLQNEIDHISNNQNEKADILRKKELQLEEEKSRRKLIEKKYKMLLAK